MTGAAYDAWMTIRFGGASLTKGFVSWRGERHDIYGGYADVVYGGQGGRVTATRVAVGAAAAGPVGAAIGAIARKKHTNVYVYVTLRDGHQISIGPDRDEAKAREFAFQLNEAAEGRGPEKDPR